MKKRGLKSTLFSFTLAMSILVGISGGLFLSYKLSPKFLIKKVGVPLPPDEKKIEETRHTLSKIDKKLHRLTKLVEDHQKLRPIPIGTPPPGYTFMFTREGVVLITESEAQEKRRLIAAVGGPTPKKKPQPRTTLRREKLP